jgi:hypothetical protein
MKPKCLLRQRREPQYAKALLHTNKFADLKSSRILIVQSRLAVRPPIVYSRSTQRQMLHYSCSTLGSLFQGNHGSSINYYLGMARDATWSLDVFGACAKADRLMGASLGGRQRPPKSNTNKKYSRYILSPSSGTTATPRCHLGRSPLSHTKHMVNLSFRIRHAVTSFGKTIFLGTKVPYVPMICETPTLARLEAPNSSCLVVFSNISSDAR